MLSYTVFVAFIFFFWQTNNYRYQLSEGKYYVQIISLPEKNPRQVQPSLHIEIYLYLIENFIAFIDINT